MKLHTFSLLVTLVGGSAAQSPAPAPTPSPAPAPIPDPELPEQSWQDIDRDGMPDVLLSHPGGPLRLLRNTGDGGFADVTGTSGLGHLFGLSEVLWQDVDRDGLPDLFVVGAAGDGQLYRNEGALGFTDATTEAGLAAHDPIVAAAFVDFDCDSRPDLALQSATGHVVFHNLGGGIFEPVELASGLAPTPMLPAVPGTGSQSDPTEAGSPGGSGNDAAPGRGSADAGQGTSTLSGPSGITPGGTGAAELGGMCMPTITDLMGGCLEASSAPMLGALYPLTEDLFVDGSTGRVGMGSTAPGRRLELNGNGVSDGLRIKYGDAYSTLYGDITHQLADGLVINANAGGGSWAEIRMQTNGNDRVFIDHQGQVGIGTDDPGAELHVDGKLQVDGNSYGTAASLTGHVAMTNDDSTALSISADGSAPALEVSSTHDDRRALFAYDKIEAGAKNIDLTTGSVWYYNRISLDPDFEGTGRGRVTTEELDVSSTAAFQGSSRFDGLAQFQGGARASSSDATALSASSGGYDPAFEAWSNHPDGRAIFSSDKIEAGRKVVDLTSGIAGYWSRVTLDPNYNGTDAGHLSLRDASANETVELSANGSTGGGFMRLRDAQGEITIVADAESSGGGSVIKLHNSVGNSTVMLDADHYSNSGRIDLMDGNGAKRVKMIVDDDGSGLIKVLRDDGSARVVLDAEDDDGNGRILCDVLEIRGGADLVESFDTTCEAPEPGTVMVIDSNGSGELTVSSQAYDRCVAGVVSGAGGVKAGLSLGQDGVMSGETQVALTGRVYVKCTAAGGAIQPGDLLTSSALAGHAMKATDAQRFGGAVIGKAMGSLDEGSGLVLVLVNLQ